MTVRHVTGDLFALGLPAIAHGCNCEGVMGAGIAVEFRRRDPLMFEAYRRVCEAGKFTPGDVLPWPREDGTVYYNLATQNTRGRDARLPAIETAVSSMLQDCLERGISEVGVPRLGAGIGGLQWPDVVDVLERCAAQQPQVTLVAVSLPPVSRRA